MRGALLLLCQAAAGESAVAEHAFFEVAAPRPVYYVQERVAVRLRFGLESRFLQDNVVPMFQRRLDVPVQVQAPWIPDLPGAFPAGEEPAAAGRPSPSFVLNDGVAAAEHMGDRVIGGRRYTVLEIERVFLPAAAGELVIPAAQLRFAYATRFADDFVSGRVPLDRRDAAISSAPLALRVLPLPEAGRPREFGGAVGRFSVQAEASPRELAAGESLKLILRIEGRGNFEHFAAPRLDGLEGFHVYGKIEEKTGAGRTVTYDLAPLGPAVKAVPEISFAYFDPDPPAAYRIVQTTPISIAVSAPPAGPESEAAAEPERSRAPYLGPLAGLFLVSGVLALWFLLRRRSPRRGGQDPEGERIRISAAAFAARSAAPGTDLAEAYAEFLAACLRCTSAAVIAPDLRARLAAAGIPPDLASRAADTLDRLVAARYGGPAAGQKTEDAQAVVAALELACRSKAAEPAPVAIP